MSAVIFNDYSYFCTEKYIEQKSKSAPEGKLECILSVTGYLQKSLQHAHEGSIGQFEPITKALISIGFLGAALIGVAETVGRAALTILAGIGVLFTLGYCDWLKNVTILNAVSTMYTGGMIIQAGVSSITHLIFLNEEIDYGAQADALLLTRIPLASEWDFEIDIQNVAEECGFIF